MRPRVGHIQFLNCLPLYYALVKNGGLLDIDLIKGAPRELSDMLLRDELDISPIPTVEYARNHEKLVILPEVSISSAGAVKSILLISKNDIKDLSGHIVAMTNTSATSQILVRIILEDIVGVMPRYFECPPDLPQMLREADAALLIGDDALRNLDAPGLHVYDLGELWEQHTKMTMVYAVWAVRRDYAIDHPEKVTAVSQMLGDSMAYSANHIDEISTYAAKYEEFSPEFLSRYFRALQYDFSDDTKAGLEYFLSEAYRLRFIHKDPRITCIEDLQCA